MNSLIKTLTPRSYTAVIEDLRKQNIIQTIQFYGFVECAKMLRFLSVMVDGETLDVPSLQYLLANLNECIEMHAHGYTDDKSLRYFNSLYKLREEIEFITSISKK